VQRVRLVKV